MLFLLHLRWRAIPIAVVTLAFCSLVGCSSSAYFVDHGLRGEDYAGTVLCIAPIRTGTFMEEALLDDFTSTIERIVGERSVFGSSRRTILNLDSLRSLGEINWAKEDISVDSTGATDGDAPKAPRLFLIVEEFSLNVGRRQSPFGQSNLFSSDKGVFGYAKYTFWDASRRKAVVSGTVQEDRTSPLGLVTADMSTSVLSALAEEIFKHTPFLGKRPALSKEAESAH